MVSQISNISPRALLIIDAFQELSLTHREVQPDPALQPTSSHFDPLNASMNFNPFPAPQMDWNMQDLVWSNLPWDWNMIDDLLVEGIGDGVTKG